MPIQQRIAGLLTCFGLAGLAATPFISQPSANAEISEKSTIAIAITSGTKLQLVRSGDTITKTVGSSAQENGMVCSSVYRLGVADLGLNCTKPAKVQSVAAIAR